MENQNSTPTLSDKLCILAHDINNGLGIIAGYPQLLLEPPNADENFKRQLRIILATAEQLASRINGHECRMQTCNAKPSEPSEPEHGLERKPGATNSSRVTPTENDEGQSVVKVKAGRMFQLSHSLSPLGTEPGGAASTTGPRSL